MIGVIDKIEDDAYQGKDFKKVTLKDGSVLKVKHGREGFLKEKWGELQVDRAYEWTMGDYQGKQFVQDFSAVSGELEKKAIEEAAKAPKPTETMSKKDWVDKDTITRTSIERQTALKEAVAWCGIKVQGGTALTYVNVIDCAVMFESYLENGATTTKAEK